MATDIGIPNTKFESDEFAFVFDPTDKMVGLAMGAPTFWWVLL